MSDIRAAESLVHKFPDEVLCEIFLNVICADFNTGIGVYEESGNRISPWNIAIVCRRWRDVCLDNPKIWSYVTFEWHECGKPHHIAPVMLTYLQIQRSGSAQLFVTAYFFCSCECVRSAFRIIARECHRWKTFHFYGDAIDSNTLQVEYLRSTDCAQLQCLNWDYLTRTVDDSLELPFRDGSLPNLHSVTFRYFTLLPIYAKPQLPWSQLKTLRISLAAFSLSELVIILSQCIDLAHLELRSRRAPGDVEVTGYEDGGIAFRNLLSLDLHDADYQDTDNVNEWIRALLPLIHSPRLRSLTYGLLDNPSTTTIFKLNEHSACALTTLDVHYGGEVPNRLLLQSLTQLQSLTIRKWFAYNQDCNAFLVELLPTNTDPSQIMLPRLSHLTIDSLEFDPVLLNEIVESRRTIPEVVPLQSLRVTFNTSTKRSLVRFNKRLLKARLNALEGFKLYIK